MAGVGSSWTGTACRSELEALPSQFDQGGDGVWKAESWEEE